jgi:hypothetical protein
MKPAANAVASLATNYENNMGNARSSIHPADKRTGFGKGNSTTSSESSISAPFGQTSSENAASQMPFRMGFQIRDGEEADEIDLR